MELLQMWTILMIGDTQKQESLCYVRSQILLPQNVRNNMENLGEHSKAACSSTSHVATHAFTSGMHAF